MAYDSHLRDCGCHDSWDQCPCAEGGHPADGSCGCCPRGTGLCGPLPAPAPVPDDERVDICCGHATCQEVVAQHTAAAVDVALTQQREGLAEAVESAVLDATFRSRDFSDGFWHGNTYAARVVREFGEGR